MPMNARRIQPPDSLRIYHARALSTAVGPIGRINGRVPAKPTEVRASPDNLFALLFHELEPGESFRYRPPYVCLGEQDGLVVSVHVILGYTCEPARTLVV